MRDCCEQCAGYAQVFDMVSTSFALTPQTDIYMLNPAILTFFVGVIWRFIVYVIYGDIWEYYWPLYDLRGQCNFLHVCPLCYVSHVGHTRTHAAWRRPYVRVRYT